MKRRWFWLLAMGVCVLATRWCALPTSGAAEFKVALPTQRVWEFPTEGVRFNADFAQARLNGCEREAPDAFRIVISPENEPINPSPWYAFQVTAQTPRTLTLHFVVTAKGSASHPRISHDGKQWKLLDKEAFKRSAKSQEAVVRIAVGPQPLWVARQELIGVAELGAWLEQKGKLPFARIDVIGRSLEDRPLRSLTLGKSLRRVLIIGRQHPPEVTGSIALMAFVDALAGQSELADRYRQRFQTTVVPMVNPDGVVHGHWRSNLGAIDLNRDWKNFSQPETRAVRDVLLQLGREKGAEPLVFIDFHSTSKDVFYAQPDSQPTRPPLFTRRWLDALHTRFPDYVFAREDHHNTGVATSKAWAYDTFGIPAITYELGYETDRALIRKVCAGAAEEMMRILLAL